MTPVELFFYIVAALFGVAVGMTGVIIPLALFGLITKRGEKPEGRP